MKTVKLPGGVGSVVLTGDDAQNAETVRIIEARYAFGVAFCEKMGWPTDFAKLSIEQILEVRSQPGWKTP